MSKQDLIHRSTEAMSYAYELCQHVQSALDGMNGITERPHLSERLKLLQIERSLKASQYLLGDVMAYLDSEATELRELLKGNQGGSHA